jgi:photosystem II stability/assembly factor-like uncharacterized protein
MDSPATDDPTDQTLQALNAKPTVASAGWRPRNRGIETADVSSLAVDAVWPAIAYAASMNGLFRTSTGGASWRRIDLPMDTPLTVLADPNRLAVAYAGGSRVDGHLYMTTDAGRTWTANDALDARERGPGQVPYARPLAIAQTDSNVMYAVVDGVRALFLARTTDGGETWTVGAAPGARATCCLAMLAPSANHAYLSTLEDAPSLHETTDGGATWKLLPLNLSFIETLAADPHDAKVLYAAGLAHGPEGPTGNVLRKSVDGGATWFAPSSELAQYSVDAVSVSNVDGRVYLIVRASVEARETEVLVSRDGAETFEPANTGLEQHVVQSVVPISYLAGGAYAATRDAGVFKTYTSGGVRR